MSSPIDARFEPDAASFDSRPLPPWFDGAKLGYLIHWGPYSVPAWAERSGIVQELWTKKGPSYFFKHNPYAEWYPNTMRIRGSATQRHHIETYGADFSYDDFVPRFNEATAKADMSDWGELFARAGARYAVLTTKHHDGYTLWPSRHHNPHKPRYHFERDLVGDFAASVRSRGLRAGLYYSAGYDETFNPTVRRNLVTAVGAIPQSREYAQYCDAHLDELIERYEPSILWSDIAYPAASSVDALFARYYDRVADGVVNDRWTQARLPRGASWAALAVAIRGVELAWPLLPKSRRRLQMRARFHHDFFTPEYETLDAAPERKWEAVRGLGLSFGNNQDERDEDMLSLEDMVWLLADVVSKGGNLMLGVAPDVHGAFPEWQTARMLGLGEWLSVNGEAIYDTKPWSRAEGTTADGAPVRFTASDSSLYAVVRGAPPPRIVLHGLVPADAAQMRFLGHEAALSWEREGERLVVNIPVPLPSPAFVLRISPPPIDATAAA